MPKRNPIITKSVARYHVHVDSITFPDFNGETLSSVDYCDFFEALNEKIYPEQPLKHLHLRPCSLEMLEGLGAYLVAHKELNIQHLHLNLNEIDDNDINGDYFQELGFVLRQLVESRVEELHIDRDESPFDQEDVEGLAKYIKSENLDYKISLPIDDQQSAAQLIIDVATQSTAARKRMALTVRENAKRKQNDEHPEEKRTRKPLQTSALSIDVELEMQIETAVQQEVATELEEPEKEKFELVKDLNELKARLQAQTLKLNLGADLVSDYDLTRAWHAWFGNVATFNLDGVRQDLQQLAPPAGAQITVHENKLIANVTVQACEQLLNYYPQFQYGIDPKQLPLGFCLVEYPEGSSNKVLHYDKNLAATSLKAPLAPALREPPQRDSLDYIRYDHYRNVLNDDDAFKRISQEVHALATPIYQREAFSAVLSFLPKLLHYSALDLETLFAFCTDEDGFHVEKLHLLLDHGDKIRSTDNTEAAIRALGSKENLEAFLSIRETNTDINQHVLFRLLAQKGELVAQIKKWVANYQLNYHNLDALLDVYNCYGSHGIEKLLAMQNMHPTLLKCGDTYAPIMSDPRFQRALDTIAKFTNEQRQWWDALYAQHTNGWSR